MKISWIVNNINQLGGIEQVVCGLSHYFSKELGHELKIISINSSESHVFFPLDSSVEILHCGLDWHTQTFSKLCKLIGRTLRTLDADILITCHSTISYAVILNKRKFHGKVVVTQHSAVDSFSKKRHLCNALLFRFADKFIVLTENDRRAFARLHCASEVIPNASFIQNDYRSSLEQKVIVSVGRLEEVKGFDRLIDAFAAVSSKFPEWKLCICGSGSVEDSLRRQISAHGLTDRVLLPGAVKNIDEYMRNASIFALSSHSEGFSLVLVEAMSHGLPTVSFDLPAVREICGGTAILFAQQGNINDFSQKLDTLMSSDSLRISLGQSAYEISKKYSIPSISNRWMSLFEELIN